MPTRASFDLLDIEKASNSIKLYVDGDNVTDNNASLIPEWLGFVKGIVVIEELPHIPADQVFKHDKIMRTIKRIPWSRPFSCWVRLYKPQNSLAYFIMPSTEMRRSESIEILNATKLLHGIREYMSLVVPMICSSTKRVFSNCGESIWFFEIFSSCFH
jgi:hypothetical protein